MSRTLTHPWWPVTVNFPSGDVDLGGWFSQNVQVNYAGVPAIEREVVEQVASFGRQLGVISEAVLELANGSAGESVAKLRGFVEEVEAIKERRKSNVKRDAKEAVERLHKLDPAELQALLRSYKV